MFTQKQQDFGVMFQDLTAADMKMTRLPGYYAIWNVG
jgi:hypothetical protein